MLSAALISRRAPRVAEIDAAEVPIAERDSRVRDLTLGNDCGYPPHVTAKSGRSSSGCTSCQADCKFFCIHGIHKEGNQRWKPLQTSTASLGNFQDGDNRRSVVDKPKGRG